MSVNRRIAFAVSASWLSRFIAIVLNLVLIPLLFRNIGQEELGLWFMLGQSGAFLGLMDLGVSPTLTRRIALAKGKSGADPGTLLNDQSKKEIADLIASGKIIYRLLTLGVFLVAWSTGFVFISQIPLQQLDYYTVWMAWSVMCMSHAIGVWSAMWGCLLQGTGHVGWDALIYIFINTLTITAQIIVTLWGGGLISLALIATFGALLSRLLTYLYIRHRQPELFTIQGRLDRKLVKDMMSPALKAWLTSLGGFIILKTDQYFIAFFKGAAEIPTYHAAYQLVHNLYVLALTFAISSSVFISQLWQAGELKKLQRIVIRNLQIGLFIMACGIACLMLSGENLINLWLGQNNFIGYKILSIFCLMLFLEAQHVIIATCSRATEDEAFALWALGSGALNLILTWLLIKPFGLLGVALATLIAQLLTNNWYAVYRGFRKLDMSLRVHIQKILLPAIVVFLISYGLGWFSIQKLTILKTDLNQVMISFLINGFVLAFLLYYILIHKKNICKI